MAVIRDLAIAKTAMVIVTSAKGVDARIVTAGGTDGEMTMIGVEIDEITDEATQGAIVGPIVASGIAMKATEEGGATTMAVEETAREMTMTDGRTDEITDGVTDAVIKGPLVATKVRAEGANAEKAGMNVAMVRTEATMSREERCEMGKRGHAHLKTRTLKPLLRQKFAVTMRSLRGRSVNFCGFELKRRSWLMSNNR
jgi:hypothetical protein